MPEDKPYIRKVYDFMQSAYGANGKLASGAFTNDFNTFYDKITTNEKYANKIYGAINDAYGSSGRVKKGAFTSKPEDFLGKVAAPKQFPMAEQLMDFSQIGKVQPVTEDPNAALAATATDIPQTLYRSADGTFKAEREPGMLSDIKAFDPLIEQKDKETQQLISDFNNTVFNTTPEVNPVTGKEVPLTDFQLNMKDYIQRIDEIEKNLQANQAEADEFAKTTAGGLYYSFVRPVYQTALNAGKNILAGVPRLAAGIGGGLGLEDSERILNKTADGIVDYFDFNRLAREGNPTAFANATPTYQQGQLSRANIIPKAMEAITSMATLMGNARVLGGNTPALFASSFLSTYEDYRKDAKQSGLTDNESDQFATISAGLTSVLEMISPNRFLLQKGELSAGAKGVFRAIKDGVPVKQAVKDAFKGTLKEIGRENIQELSQSIGDNVVRRASDMVTGQNEFNQGSILPTVDQALETIVLTSIATGVMSGRRLARNANPSNIERSAWAQAAERPELIEQGIERGLENGTVTEEQAGKIRQDVAEYRNIYDALQAELSATNPNADVARVAFDAFKSQRLKQETQPLQGIPALAAVQDQTAQRNAELEGNIRDELAGIPEMGSEVSASGIKDIMAQTGAENKLDQVGDNDYKVSTIDLANLYRTNEEFKRYVDEERLTESKDKEGLITPVVISASGNIIDGMNRLAQQYVDGEKTARAFVGMKGISVQEDVQKPRVAPTASQERGITVQRPQDITRIDPITIGENQAPVVQEEQPFEIAPVFAGEEVIPPVQETVPAQPVTPVIEQTPVDQAKTRRDNAAAKLKEAWSAYGQMGVINDPGRNLERDKKFYSALANYVKEEILYRVNQVKGFASKKKAAMKREIIKSIRDQGIEVDDLSQLNDAFETAYEEAKNIPGVLSENNDRVSYRKYIKDRIIAREVGRKKGEKEATETAEQKVKDVRAAILETAKGTGVKINITQLRQLSRLLERAVKSKDVAKSINDAIGDMSQMIWESKNRDKIAQAKKLIKQANALKRNKNQVVRDVEWLQQIQFPNPNQVDDIDQYVEYLQNFTGTRKGNKEVSDATREEFQDLVDQENARIYSEKKAKWQAELDELIADDILPADVTLDEYIQLLEGQSVDRLDSGTNKKQDVLIGWIKPRLAALKSGTNEFTGPISAMNEDQKSVVDQLSSINVDDLSTGDLIMLNNVLNNIAEYGSVDGAGPLITSDNARKINNAWKDDTKIRSLAVTNKKGISDRATNRLHRRLTISNILARLLYNDGQISQFRAKTLGLVESAENAVYKRAQKMVKSFAELNKKHKIKGINNSRLHVYSFINQFRGITQDEQKAGVRQKVDELIDDVNHFISEANRVKRSMQPLYSKEMINRLDALKSMGLINYELTEAKEGKKKKWDVKIEITPELRDRSAKRIMSDAYKTMSYGEKAVYNFVLRAYEGLSDKLEFVTRTFANKAFVREQNYVSLVARKKSGTEKIDDSKFSDETDITGQMRGINRRPAGTTLARAPKKPEGIYYDGDFYSNFVSQYYKSLYTAEVLPGLQTLAKVVNDPKFEKFISGQLDKGFDGDGSRNFELFMNKLSQVVNAGKYSPFMRVQRDGWLHVLGSKIVARSVRIALNTIKQGIAQYLPGLLHSFAINNTNANRYALGTAFMSLSPWHQEMKAARNQFLSNFTGVRRSALGSEIHDKYIKGLVDDPGLLTRVADGVDKVGDIFSKPLEYGDRAVQNHVIVSAYITSLLKQGVIKSANEFNFEDHANAPNKEAVAFAEQQASSINNESNKAYRPDVLRDSENSKYLWMLQGFALNAYQNAKAKTKIILDSRRTTEERNEAYGHLLGYIGETVMYRLVGLGAKGFWGAVTTAALMPFGLAHDDDEEETKNKWEKEAIKTGSQLVLDPVLSGQNALLQAAVKNGINLAYQAWAKNEVKEKRKAAKARGETFDPRGTSLSPYFVPFYGADGPQGSAQFWTEAGRKGISLMQEGMGWNYDEEKERKKSPEQKEMEQLAKTTNMALVGLSIILQSGDLAVFNRELQKELKEATPKGAVSSGVTSGRSRPTRSRPRRSRPR